MTFEAWLKKQKNRDDAIGGLAKSFIIDSRRAYEQIKKKIKVIESIGRHRVTDKVMDVYESALREYIKTVKVR